ncbi:hypothetical protein HGRIS_008831 [Hohenbuehelia grisea]|uniref:Uncharacterized protein n=1 Tax=Hohenbuehelia grisea TaxID=104357 RepID=A0ABR3IZ96_9AGAR
MPKVQLQRSTHVSFSGRRAEVGDGACVCEDAGFERSIRSGPPSPLSDAPASPPAPDNAPRRTHRPTLGKHKLAFLLALLSIPIPSSTRRVSVRIALHPQPRLGQEQHIAPRLGGEPPIEHARCC